MSELSNQYLALLAKASQLKEKFDKNGGDIRKSTTFLAEDWRLCVEQMNALSTGLYREHDARCGYSYTDCPPRLRRGHWRHNPSLKKQEGDHHSSVRQPA